eukprot:8586276-Prorocentrum_lima.AAC.1
MQHPPLVALGEEPADLLDHVVEENNGLPELPEEELLDLPGFSLGPDGLCHSQLVTSEALAMDLSQ